MIRPESVLLYKKMEQISSYNGRAKDPWLVRAP